VRGADRPRTDVVQHAVVRLAHDGVDRAHRLHPGACEQPLDHRVGRLPDAERAGQQDRRLELAELLELCRADQLAEAIGDVERRRHALAVEVAAVRKDRGHAGAHRVALDDGRLADAHAGDVGDRVQRPRRHHADRDTGFTRARPLGRALGIERSGHQQQRKEQESGSVHESVAGCG
jgi:hypothetical protein